MLEAADAASTSTVRTSETTTRAQNLATKTVRRLGFWVKIVLRVPQPYSLPIASTPRMMAIDAPRPLALESAMRWKCCGYRARMRSAGVVPAGSDLAKLGGGFL